jgi:parvulin-like peptidyl-prolyl isomerase
MLVASAASLAILSAQACQSKSESYTTLTAQELTALTDTFPPQQKEQLRNPNGRKAFVTQLKQMFSLAQAAQAEGLDKGDEFKRQSTIRIDQLLVGEAMRRNPDEKYTEEEGKAYLAAHQADFDADIKAAMVGAPQQPTPEMIEQLKPQWSEMKVRAEKARKAGLEKDPQIIPQIKIRRANMLADLYAKHLQEKFKPTPEELKEYVAAHPEADLEKIKQKAQGLLTRVKNGEDFEAIAKQFTEDGSRDAGGDLGWFGEGKMDPVFEKAAFSLQKGQISDLIESSFGFHIIRVDDRRTVKNTEPAAQAPTPAGGEPKPTEATKEEVRARHIYLSTQEAKGIDQEISKKKIQRAMEDTTLKYAVAAPEDFPINLGGSQQAPPAIDRNSGKIITPDK